MTGNSYPRIYDAGSLEVSAKVLSGFGLDPLSSELMLRLGLPSRLPGEVPLVQFEAPQSLEFDGEELLVVAREPWGGQLLLCLSPGGKVIAAGDGMHQFVNSRLSSFLGFLSLYEAFQEQARSGNSGPVVYSQSEMQARLEAFRRGEFQARPTEQRFNRDVAISTMAAEWTTLDPAALVEGAWWSVVLEQLEDGQI
ncbi:SUKH-4 family immunity protein [Stenotrophomonas sp. S39]|uniref:SUKH-4 family immunity protein n=1 Tax=Stenotrophomonas sp. S39 TaxID=2767451 RepID=UPI00190BBDC7|nr:SUKH-4 family immunity protein [Stenotrophomonas sp. S39]MBK0055325.1 SUKH-4 family immunity protein [Stenotrophomonas sp. S39]